MKKEPLILENPIDWCDDTANIVTGCDKVSEGCKNCYAAAGTRARVLRAQGIETWGPRGVRHPVAEFETKFRRLNKLCICDKCHRTFPHKYLTHEAEMDFCPTCCDKTLRRIRLFADSNSDWLDKRWKSQTLVKFLDLIFECENLDFLLLTKRPENFLILLERAALWKMSINGGSGNASQICKWMQGTSPNNIWIGVSVENQKTADERIPEILKIPAKVRFLSAEPLLEPFNITLYRVSWVIVGGESGPHHRDCGVEAIVDVAAQCVAANVPVYVKQDCALKPGQQGRIPEEIWSLKEFPKVAP